MIKYLFYFISWIHYYFVHFNNQNYGKMLYIIYLDVKCKRTLTRPNFTLKTDVFHFLMEGNKVLRQETVGFQANQGARCKLIQPSGYEVKCGSFEHPVAKSFTSAM